MCDFTERLGDPERLAHTPDQGARGWGTRLAARGLRRVDSTRGGGAPLSIDSAAEPSDCLIARAYVAICGDLTPLANGCDIRSALAVGL
jgi:hypothetical protein